MRAFITMAVAGTLTALALPAAAAESAAPAKCPPLEIHNNVQMFWDEREEFVPVTMQGEQKYFLLDTGAGLTQIDPFVADELHMSSAQWGWGSADLAGNFSSRAVMAKDGLLIGRMQTPRAYMFVSPLIGSWDGLLAMDYFAKSFDADFDFGTDTLRLFSQNHCLGAVAYWTTADKVGTVPMTLRDNHIRVSVTLDGQPLDAIIDTGATSSAMTVKVAEDIFKLRPGDTETPADGIAYASSAIKNYSHAFKQLTFGAVVVDNPEVTIVQDHGSGMNEMLIGMDVLSRLHVYMAFKEGNIYVSAIDPHPANWVAPYPSGYAASRFAKANQMVKQRPNFADSWEERCVWGTIIKADLDGAMADCRKALAIDPDDVAAQNYIGNILFLQGKYPEALQAYDAVLKAHSEDPVALYMRGRTKEGLGDADGGQADIAAATQMDSRASAFVQRRGFETSPAKP